MGRKDLTAERQATILDAMERCIARFGLQGTTLENIAGEAGINRGLIHHYIGNRQDVVRMMVERLMERYQASFAAYAATRPQENRAGIVLEYYFKAWFDLAPQDDAVILGLLAESERDAEIRQLLRELYDGFESMIAAELLRFYPAADPARVHSVAYALMLLAFSHSTLTWLGLPQAARTDIASIAATLISPL